MLYVHLCNNVYSIECSMVLIQVTYCAWDNIVSIVVDLWSVVSVHQSGDYLPWWCKGVLPSAWLWVPGVLRIIISPFPPLWPRAGGECRCPSCVTASGVATSSLTPDTDIAPAPCLKTLAAGIRVISSSNVQLCTLCSVMQADLCALACVHRAPTAQLPCVRNFAIVSSVQHLSPAPH